jgi:pimeloyl-ACP methyl ester carboxylesterase
MNRLPPIQQARYTVSLDLVTLAADDGAPLDGALYTPLDAPAARTGIALFHGTGGEFYIPLFRALGEGLAARGWPVLALNRRDHGASFGFVTLARGAMDQRAAIDFLASRGAARVVLGGHSYGTVTVPWYVATTNDARVPGMLLYAALGDLRPASVAICGGQERYDAFVAEARAAVAAGRGDEAFVIPPMVAGYLPMTNSYAVFLDKRGPESEAAPIELIRRVGNRPSLALRHARDPFPATLPPARAQLEAANRNLTYVLVAEGENGPPVPEAHFFAGHEDAVLAHTIDWLSAQGFAP